MGPIMQLPALLSVSLSTTGAYMQRAAGGQSSSSDGPTRSETSAACMAGNRSS